METPRPDRQRFSGPDGQPAIASTTDAAKWRCHETEALTIHIGTLNPVQISRRANAANILARSRLRDSQCPTGYFGL